MHRHVWKQLWNLLFFNKPKHAHLVPPKRYLLLFGEAEISLFFLSPEREIPLRLHSCTWEEPPEVMMPFLETEPHSPIDFFYGGSGQLLKTEPIPDTLGHWDMLQWSKNKWHFFEKQSFFSSLHYQLLPERRLIFGSFPKQERIETWLKALKGKKRCVEHISLFIFVQGSFYKKLHESLCEFPSPWLCVVSFEDKKMIRHTILHQGCVLLTRLLPHTSAEDLKTQEIEKEIHGTLRYISKTACTISETIDLLILKQQEDGLRFSSHLNEIKHSWTLFSEQIEQLCGFQRKGARLVDLSLAFAHPHPPALKPLGWSLQGYSRRYFEKRWYIKSGLAAVGCVSVLVVYFSLDLFRLEAQFSELQESVQSLAYQEKDLDKHLNTFPFSADRLRQALWIENTLTSPRKALEEVLQKLPEILQNKLRLRQFDWQCEELGNKSVKSLILEAYPIVEVAEADLEHLFDQFLALLKKQFPTCVFDILHGPYGSQPTRLLTGGLGEENNDTDPSCIVKVTWPD
jgi:hypothetical protein